jgi:hypothetical protein
VNAEIHMSFQQLVTGSFTLTHVFEGGDALLGNQSSPVNLPKVIVPENNLIQCCSGRFRDMKKNNRFISPG